jgi:long-chain acyl-CoA synthetase
MGEELIALVVLAPDSASCTEADVLARCRASLAKMKCPTRIEFVGATGRNSMGKVNRRTIRDLYLDGGPDAFVERSPTGGR